MNKTNWQKITVSPQATIMQAMQVIDQNSSRIVLVVTADNNLLGTLTDGDIRRAIMDHKALDSEVQAIMNPNPITVQIGTPLSMIRSIMEKKDLLVMPVLKDGKVIDLIQFKEFFSKPKIDNPVLLMAGGFGKRLGNMTKSCPKPMLKVGNKPIMETILISLVEAGFQHFYISLHYLPELIKDYFGDGSRWGVDIEYIYESEPLGTAGGLGLLPDLNNDLPLLVMNCDLLTKLDFASLINYHNVSKSDITMCVREFEYKIPYGVIETNGDKLVGVVEKPTKSHFVNAGIYVVGQRALQSVDRNEYLDMPELINRCVSNQSSVQVFPVHEYWLDIGQYDDFQQAQDDYIRNFA
jgi:dTDP-glucose pyrophosphorylase